MALGVHEQRVGPAHAPGLGDVLACSGVAHPSLIQHVVHGTIGGRDVAEIAVYGHIVALLLSQCNKCIVDLQRRLAAFDPLGVNLVDDLLLFTGQTGAGRGHLRARIAGLYRLDGRTRVGLWVRLGIGLGIRRRVDGQTGLPIGRIAARRSAGQSRCPPFPGTSLHSGGGQQDNK